MRRPERKYALDTNLFIDGFRDEKAKARLIRFHMAFAPFEYFSAVVLQELRAGVTSQDDLRLLERSVLDPFIRRGRLVTRHSAPGSSPATFFASSLGETVWTFEACRKPLETTSSWRCPAEKRG